MAFKEVKTRHGIAVRNLVSDHGLRSDGTFNLCEVLRNDRRLEDFCYQVGKLRKLNPDELYRLIAETCAEQLECAQIAAQFAAEIASIQIEGVPSFAENQSPTVPRGQAEDSRPHLNDVHQLHHFTPTLPGPESLEKPHEPAATSLEQPTTNEHDRPAAAGISIGKGKGKSTKRPRPESDSNASQRPDKGKQQKVTEKCCPGNYGNYGNNSTCSEPSSQVNRWKTHFDSAHLATYTFEKPDGTTLYRCQDGCPFQTDDAKEFTEHTWSKHV